MHHSYASQQPGSDFSTDDLFAQLASSEKLIVFYQSRLSWQGHLLMIDNEQKTSLWTGEHVPPSGLVPQPILAAGWLNQNDMPDILLCYAVDRGTGQGSDFWDQEMRLFFDWQPGGGGPIPLSAIERYLTGEGTADAYGIRRAWRTSHSARVACDDLSRV